MISIDIFNEKKFLTSLFEYVHVLAGDYITGIYMLI